MKQFDGVKFKSRRQRLACERLAEAMEDGFFHYRWDLDDLFKTAKYLNAGEKIGIEIHILDGGGFHVTANIGRVRVPVKVEEESIENYGRDADKTVKAIEEAVARALKAQREEERKRAEEKEKQG